MERRHLVGIAGGDAGAPADNGSWVGRGEELFRALLLIGTEILEQSLDIDADLLITDLCSMDVLLQRIGRLHRHAERSRPPGFRQARCILLVPETGDLESLLDAKGEAGATPRKSGLGRAMGCADEGGASIVGALCKRDLRCVPRLKTVPTNAVLAKMGGEASYYLEKGRYVPSDPTPLLWTQGNLMVALVLMERSLQKLLCKPEP